MPYTCYNKEAYDKSKTIGAEVKNMLHEVCSGFRPYSGVRVEFISEPPDDIFANALVFYGNITRKLRAQGFTLAADSLQREFEKVVGAAPAPGGRRLPGRGRPYRPSADRHRRRDHRELQHRWLAVRRL